MFSLVLMFGKCYRKRVTFNIRMCKRLQTPVQPSERYFLKKSFPSFYISLCTKLQKTRHTFYPFPVIIITCYRDKSITGGRDIFTYSNALKDFTSAANFSPPDRNICCVSDLQCLRLEGHGKKTLFF